MFFFSIFLVFLSCLLLLVTSSIITEVEVMFADSLAYRQRYERERAICDDFLRSLWDRFARSSKRPTELMWRAQKKKDQRRTQNVKIKTVLFSFYLCFRPATTRFWSEMQWFRFEQVDGLRRCVSYLITAHCRFSFQLSVVAVYLKCSFVDNQQAQVERER